MAIPQYDGLTLWLEPAGHKEYSVRAQGPDGAAATGMFESPVSEVELDNFILRWARSRVVRSAYSSETEDAKELGGALFDRLLSDDVGDVYHGARRVAESQGRGLRITLSMTGAPELLEIPWELLYDRAAASFLSDSIFTPVVRSLDLKNPPMAPPLTLPFKVLGVVSAPGDFPALDADAERAKLETALGSLVDNGAVELEWLEPATLSALDRRIAAPDDLHVIHYIGHGAYDKRTRGGILALEDPHGAPHEVSGEEVGRCMKDERSLRLVVLNSCEGARGSHVDPFSGVATSLLRCGLPAVIGMQAEITDEAAIAFSDRLYTALAQGFPIDAATAQARRGIAAAGRSTEFGTPVLFMRVSDGQIFNVTKVLPPPPPGRLELQLRAEPAAVQAGEVVTWHLEIRNSGGSRLNDVTVRDRAGETRAGPLALDPGRTHEAMWMEAVEDGVEERVTVEGRPTDGELLTEDAEAQVRVARGGGWWPPSKTALLAVAGLLAALIVALLVLPGGGEDSVDFTPFPVGADVPDLDARGEKLAFQAPVGGGATEIRRLDLESKKSELWADAAPDHNGMDMGINDSGRAQLVYSRCDPAASCSLYTKPFNGDAKPLAAAASKPDCSETRPSMWDGLVLFARGGPGCAPELILTSASGTNPKHVAGGSRGSDLNDGVALLLSPEGDLVTFDVTPDGKVTHERDLEPSAGEQFTAPLTVENGYAYFVHGAGGQFFIARTKLPLGGSKVEHYSAYKGDEGVEDSPHFTVTRQGHDLYTANYPQPDGKSGSNKIVRVEDPKFNAAD